MRGYFSYSFNRRTEDLLKNIDKTVNYLLNYHPLTQKTLMANNGLRMTLFRIKHLSIKAKFV